MEGRYAKSICSVLMFNGPYLCVLALYCLFLYFSPMNEEIFLFNWYFFSIIFIEFFKLGYVLFDH